MTISNITDESWKGILKVQDEAYTHVPSETLDVLKSKWEASPETCFVFRSNSKDIVGYLLSHPWGSDEPPKLFEKHSPCLSGHTLYLHDLAVRQSSRGLGVGKQLANRLLHLSTLKKFNRILLVAIQGSEDFWFNLGFREVNNVSVCSSYGFNAKLMSLNVKA